MPSCHAFVITSPEGIEVLVHVGIDTVKLPAGVLQPLCATGEQVSQGERILQVDEEKLRASGYDLSTAIVVLQEEMPCCLQMHVASGDSCHACETRLYNCEYDDGEISESSKQAPAQASSAKAPAASASATLAPAPSPAPTSAPSTSPISTSARYMNTFLGGALGTLARYGVCVACGLGFSHPIVILTINLIGSFVLGYAQICIDDSHPRLKQAVTSGFCGAFTSYASVIAILAFLSMSPPHALFYAVVCLVGGTCCALVGRFCGRMRAQAKHGRLCLLYTSDAADE